MALHLIAWLCGGRVKTNCFFDRPAAGILTFFLELTDKLAAVQESALALLDERVPMSVKERITSNIMICYNYGPPAHQRTYFWNTLLSAAFAALRDNPNFSWRLRQKLVSSYEFSPQHLPYNPQDLAHTVRKVKHGTHVTVEMADLLARYPLKAYTHYMTPPMLLLYNYLMKKKRKRNSVFQRRSGYLYGCI